MQSYRLSFHSSWMISSSAVIALVYYLCHRKISRLEERWRRQCKEERTGRIRAECRVRQMEKLVHTTRTTTGAELSKSIIMKPIGIVTSPYLKRMGTPRQPQVVPASRGYVQFSIPAATLDGIECYSHVWILFQFHANTNLETSRKTKIRPPRANGETVGQLASRSPHRPNPIGLSLASVAAWLPEKLQLHLRGLDLVHGTPVLDIKPCVPWDIPMERFFRVPRWVEQDDSIARVTFTNAALEELEKMIDCGKLSPLYTKDDDGYQGALDTLSQVLAQDPRSSHRGLKTNSRGTINSSSSSYSLTFGHTRIEFTVSEVGVEVLHVIPVNFVESAYTDGVPLIGA